MERLDVNLRHLRAFLAIMESGSVTAAAREVHLTQPAVTQGIAKLELRFGVPLFGFWGKRARRRRRFPLFSAYREREVMQMLRRPWV